MESPGNPCDLKIRLSLGNDRQAKDITSDKLGWIIIPIADFYGIHLMKYVHLV